MARVPCDLGVVDVGVAGVALQPDEGAELVDAKDLLQLGTINDLHAHAPLLLLEESLLLRLLLARGLDLDSRRRLFIDLLVHVQHAKPPALDAHGGDIPEARDDHVVHLTHDAVVLAGRGGEGVPPVAPLLRDACYDGAPEDLGPKDHERLKDKRPCREHQERPLEPMVHRHLLQVHGEGQHIRGGTDNEAQHREEDEPRGQGAVEAQVLDRGLRGQPQRVNEAVQGRPLLSDLRLVALVTVAHT
mmetsp:Transcript_30448/g.88275  ORF Transcript_30448/g.88275 Transcript_30448/m.88275 type:complete len:245 (+) Transcript_30448:665-1399(+)